MKLWLLANRTYLMRPLVLLAVSPISLSARQAPTGGSLALTGVTVIDVASGTRIADQTVIVAGDRIAQIGPTGPTRVPSGAASVNAAGKFLIPGLWDMHVHLSYARPSALPVLLANGVTGVRDVGSDLQEIDAWRAEIAAAVRRGPRIVRAGPMLNGRSFNQYQLATGGPEQARGIVRALKQAGVDLIKVHRRTARDDYFAIIDEAGKQGLSVAGHIPMTVTPFEASAAGQQIEHAYTLFEGTLLNGQSETHVPDVIQDFLGPGGKADSLFAQFVRNHTVVDVTLVTYHRAADSSLLKDPGMRYVAQSGKDTWKKIGGTPAAEEFAVRQRVDAGLQAVAARMQRAGVTLLAGTDLSIILPPGFSLHEELALLVRAGLSTVEALRAATLNPSMVMKRDRLFGTVTAGKMADLVLLDADPLADINNTNQIRAVIKSGKLLDRAALDALLAEGERLARRD
jgi:imidazolonepropionase-like amidohydrolase